MIINRVWAMPNKKTFTIKPIKELLERYEYNKCGVWLDPFPYPYKEDAQVYLKRCDFLVDGIVYDPPYSPRQVKECYESQGISDKYTNHGYFAKVKDMIAKRIYLGGLCISFGWSSVGLGKNRGFEIIEIMLVSHGGGHNDTIVTVEKRIKKDL